MLIEVRFSCTYLLISYLNPDYESKNTRLKNENYDRIHLYATTENNNLWSHLKILFFANWKYYVWKEMYFVNTNVNTVF